MRAPLGFALGLAAGLGWAIGTLILKRGQVMVNALVLTGWQLLIAVPTTVGALVLAERALVHAVVADDRGRGLHRAGADEHRQRRVVLDRRHAAE